MKSISFAIVGFYFLLFAKSIKGKNSTNNFWRGIFMILSLVFSIIAIVFVFLSK